MKQGDIKRIQNLMQIDESRVLLENSNEEFIPTSQCVDIIEYLVETRNPVFENFIENVPNVNRLDLMDDDGSEIIGMLSDSSKLFGTKYDDIDYLDYFLAFVEKNLSLIRDSVFDKNLYQVPTLKKYKITTKESYTARHDVERETYASYYSGYWLINETFLYLEYNEGRYDPYDGDNIEDDWEMIDTDGWEIEDIEIEGGGSVNENRFDSKNTLLNEISSTNDIERLLTLEKAIRQRLKKFGR